MNQLNSCQNDIKRNYISNNYIKNDNRKINNNEINNNTNERNLHFSNRNKKFDRRDYDSYFNNYTEIPFSHIYPENNINNDKDNIYNIQQTFQNNRKMKIKKDSNNQKRINISPIDTPKEYKIVKPEISFNNIKRYNTNINDPNIQKNAKKVIVMKIIKNNTLNQIKIDNQNSNKKNLTNTEFREKRKVINFNDNRFIDKKLKYNYSEKFQNVKNELLFRNVESLNYPYNKSFTNIINDNNNKFDLTSSKDILNFPKNKENFYGHINNISKAKF